MSSSRQVLKFDLNPDSPLTTIPIEDDRFYLFTHAGASSVDQGWTEVPSVWVVDRARNGHDSEVTELTVLSIPDNFEVNGDYVKFITDGRVIGTITNSDKSYVRHVFDATSY